MNCSKCNHPLTFIDKVSQYNPSEKVAKCEKCGSSFSVRMDERIVDQTENIISDEIYRGLAEFITNIYKLQTNMFDISKISSLLSSILEEQIKNKWKCRMDEDGYIYIDGNDFDDDGNYHEHFLPFTEAETEHYRNSEYCTICKNNIIFRLMIPLTRQGGRQHWEEGDSVFSVSK